MKREVKYNTRTVRQENYFIIATQKLTKHEDEESFYPSQHYQYAIGRIDGESIEQQHLLQTGTATDNQLQGLLHEGYVRKHLRDFLTERRRD